VASDPPYKVRVTWYVGRRSWRHDLRFQTDADEKVRRLLSQGFKTTSKAGVVTYHPAHRISRIKVRKITLG